MTESFSLKNLFTAGMSKEQFLAKYSELKENVAQGVSSIFGEEMENSVAQIFDTVNTDGDVLEQSEIDALIALSTEDGDNVLSESDMKVLYQKMARDIASKYPVDTPENMYENAMQGVDDIYSASYIQDLSTQINVLHQLKAQRQNNSTGLVHNYQSQIDDMIFKSKNLSVEFKMSYKSKSEQITKLQKENDKNNAELERLEEEKHDIQLEKSVIQKELENFDEEDDEAQIESRKNELSSLDRRLAGLDDTQTVIRNNIQINNKKLNTAKADLAKLTKQAQEQDSSISTDVKALKDKIKSEEDSLHADIADFDSQIETLENAQRYAVFRIQERGAGQYDTDSSDSHKNDNLMSFDELSNNGMKYSGEKGQKLAASVRSHLKGFTGYCSRHVSNALAETGLGNERAGSAHMMDSLLANNQNFEEITISSQEDLKKLPAGCVLVYEAGAAGYNAKHGHIEVTLGDGTAGSDGVTRNLRYTQNMHVFVPVENA